MTAQSSVFKTVKRVAVEPSIIQLGQIPAFQYRGNLASELAAKTITPEEALALLEDMLITRELEMMIVKLRAGAYPAVGDYNYGGPTHVSIGQEATSHGACSVLDITDNITSTHRGHADAVAKGTTALRRMSEEELRQRVPGSGLTGHADLLEAALEDHVFRLIADLFGKDEGYSAGRGGSMHLADFSVGHIGANAIVGAGVPIATGAALANRYLERGNLVCCFAGDGAYANGVALESLNFAAQAQFTNHYAGSSPFGLPIIYLVVNNHYAMTCRTDDEVSGISHMARRAAGFADNNMHAEVVDGMNVLAVRDAVARAADLCRAGKGPVFIEASCYRFFGHFLADPRTDYRSREEEESWKPFDPIETFKQELIANNLMDADGIAALEAQVADRNARAAQRAVAAADPPPEDIMKFMYTDGTSETVPAEFLAPDLIGPVPQFPRDNGQLTYRDALREALTEEMLRDKRVILYGEDIADYGGPFKATQGLLNAFGRRRVFNTPISEACICGTGVGAAMNGLRPIVELMYFDFALMASDQISNQAAKWHYMTGGQAEVPLVIRASAHSCEGYGGQHSQTLESIFAHIPGLYVVYPATPHDVKGMLKSAIRDNNPVLFIEAQALFGMKGPVADEDYLVPLGVADVKRMGDDITIVTWGPLLHPCLAAAERLMTERNVTAEVIDLRSLVPLDMETVLRSVKKTGRCVVASEANLFAGFTGEIASNIQQAAFDYLDAPIVRVGAKNCVAPFPTSLEAVYQPRAGDVFDAAVSIL